MTTSTQQIDASPDDVFAMIVDAESYPRWLVGARYVRTDPDWPRPGSEFGHEVGAGPLTTQDRTTATDVEPGRSLDLIVRARPFLEADVHFEVSPSGDGTIVRLTEELRGRFRVIGPVVAPLVKWRNDRSLARLAQQFGTRSTDA